MTGGAVAGQWVLQHKANVERFTASFPENSNETPPSFVAISQSGVKRIMKSATRAHASGNELWISDKDLTEIQNGAQVSIKASSAKRYRLYRVFHDRKLRLALFGLILSIVAVAITGTVAIGKERPLVIVSRTVFAISLWVGLLCQIVGAVLLFLKGVLEAD